jgi:hypothetical protein
MAVRYTIKYAILDEDGDKSSVTFRLAEEFGPDAENWAYIISQYVDDVIDGQIYEIQICTVIELPVGLKDGPENRCDVQRVASLFHRANGYPVSTAVPTFRRDLFLPGTKDVDLDDSDVAALLDIILNGFVVDTDPIHPTDNRGVAIDEFVRAKEVFRPRKR